MHYSYCPICGTKLVDHPAGDDGMVPFCEPCGRYYFDSFPSAVLTMVVGYLRKSLVLCIVVGVGSYGLMMLLL